MLTLALRTIMRDWAPTGADTADIMLEATTDPAGTGTGAASSAATVRATAGDASLRSVLMFEASRLQPASASANASILHIMPPSVMRAAKWGPEWASGACAREMRVPFFHAQYPSPTAIVAANA